jgi:hypothetical protein
MFALGLSVATASSGCHRQTGPSTAAPPAAPAHASGPKGPVWSGVPLRGNSTESLRAYLSTVEEVKPKRFEVHWNPATVAIDKAAALRSLRAVSRDGAIITFASDEPAVAQLKPGSILWVWDIAVRKVDSIETYGDVTRVHTSEVKLNEAMPDAQIEFEAPLKLQNYFPQRQIEKPEPAAQTAQWRPHRRSSGLIPVSLTDLPPEDLPNPDQPGDSDDDDWYDEGITQDGFNGTKNGWAYSLKYQTRSGGLTVELQARKGDLEGGSATTTSNLVPEYKKIELDRKDIQKGLDQAQQELRDEEKGVTDTDKQFQQQMTQLLEDQANRKNPSYLGPSLPPQVNRYGEPITDSAAQQLLRDRWQKQHDLEIQKLQANEQILGEWRNKKEQLEARRRALKVAQGVAAQLWQIVDDSLDARIRGRIDLDGFAVGGNLGFVNSNIDVAATQFKNLNGKVQVQLIGRLGKPGNEAIKIPVMHLPISFNVPIPVGGIPFVVQLGSDFLITLTLSGMHATLAADGQVAFKGDSGFTYAKGNVNYDSTFSSSGDPEITNAQGMSPGVSAVVLAIQMPRIGMGLGVFGVSSVSYMDVVNVVTMTQAAAVGIGLLPLCRRTTYNTVGRVGIETNIVPLPFLNTSSVAGELSMKPREIFNTTTKKIDPPQKACDI